MASIHPCIHPSTHPPIHPSIHSSGCSSCSFDSLASGGSYKTRSVENGLRTSGSSRSKNAKGVDVVCPDDDACPDRIGRHYHQHAETKEIIYGEADDLPMRPYIARGGKSCFENPPFFLRARNGNVCMNVVVACGRIYWSIDHY